jgi:serine/threonine protein kinase
MARSEFFRVGSQYGLDDVFERHKVLGTGQSGVVYRAIHKLSGQNVALKILEKARVDAKRERWISLRQEILMLKFIHHPNLVQFYDVIETSTQYTLVTEYLEGTEFFLHLRDHIPLSRSMALNYFHQLVMGMLHCHEMGIAHRDLKPENIILMKSSPILKIIDFGLANYSTDGTMISNCGSPNYASPEVVQSNKYNGCLADVWSLGVILYVMVTGELPFYSDNVKVLLTRICKGEYSFPSDVQVDSDVVDLIQNLIQVDVTKRFTLKQVLKHPVFSSWIEDKEATLDETTGETGETIGETGGTPGETPVGGTRMGTFDRGILDDMAFLLQIQVEEVEERLETGCMEEVKLYKVMHQRSQERQKLLTDLFSKGGKVGAPKSGKLKKKLEKKFETSSHPTDHLLSKTCMISCNSNQKQVKKRTFADWFISLFSNCSRSTCCSYCSYCTCFTCFSCCDFTS